MRKVTEQLSKDIANIKEALSNPTSGKKVSADEIKKVESRIRKEALKLKKQGRDYNDVAEIKLQHELLKIMANKLAQFRKPKKKLSAMGKNSKRPQDADRLKEAKQTLKDHPPSKQYRSSCRGLADWLTLKSGKSYSKSWVNTYLKSEIRK